MLMRGGRTITVIHSENILLEDIYVNSTDTKQEVGFDFSSLNVSRAAQPNVLSRLTGQYRRMAPTPSMPTT